MSESSNDHSKADKKREYNRNAQRVFRQRRKEHLTKLEASQREQSNLQGEEVNRLRRENQALAQENETLKAAYSSAASSPGPSLSPSDMRSSASTFVTYEGPSIYLDPSTAASLASSSTIPALSLPRGSSNALVVVPNNLREIRRSLHQLLAPLMELSVASNPQNHIAILTALEPSLPPALKPTHLQLTTPHHAYIDMIPSPMLRDCLVAIGPAQSNSFLMEVCTIACDIPDNGQMIIWGEDWLNDFSWEFSATVLERWGGWLLGSEWGRRANFWRRQRGAPILPGYD